MVLRRALMGVATVVLVGGAVALSAGSASASTNICPDMQRGCGAPGWYTVTGTGGGSLNLRTTPAVGNNVIGPIPDGASVDVFCQINNGGDDSGAGIGSRTWDRVSAYVNGVWQDGWAYDWFVSTPPQDINGWSLTTVC